MTPALLIAPPHLDEAATRPPSLEQPAYDPDRAATNLQYPLDTPSLFLRPHTTSLPLFPDFWPRLDRRSAVHLPRGAEPLAGS